MTQDEEINHKIKLASDLHDVLGAIYKARAHEVRQGSFTVHMDGRGKPTMVEINVKVRV